MISDAGHQQIQAICRKYGATKALLFGSSLDSSPEARDIDLAVEGVAPRDFFRFYGELMFALSKPVDVVDLSGQSKSLDLVRRDGVLLYGGPEGADRIRMRGHSTSSSCNAATTPLGEAVRPGTGGRRRTAAQLL